MEFAVLPSGKSYMTIIGIDPGTTTGYAALRIREETEKPDFSCITERFVTQITMGFSGNQKTDARVESEAEAVALMYKAILYESLNATYTFVACEDFVVRMVNSSPEFLTPVKIAAGLNQLIYSNPIAPVIMQLPANAKGVCTDERMAAWGFPPVKHADRHGRDAERHAALLLRNIMASRHSVDKFHELLLE